MNYTKEQNHLIAELSATYGVEPEEIIFFHGDPKPLFAYEAGCVIANALTDLRGIDIEPVNNGFIDSISYRCILTRTDGASRSAVGVANINETDENGKKLTTPQLEVLASGRAFRNVLRVAGIDLLKLHNQAMHGVVPFGATPKTNYANLLGQAHHLGQMAGLIIGDDKSAWRTILRNRYGVNHSNELSESQLADFVAVLNTLVPQTRQKAA